MKFKVMTAIFALALIAGAAALALSLSTGRGEMNGSVAWRPREAGTSM